MDKRVEAWIDDGISLGRLDEFLGFRFRRIQNVLSRRFSEAVSSYGLRSGEFTSLAIIAANPGISQNAVAREVQLDKSQVVVIIDDLESRGWAERKRSTTDRRRHSLFITPAGEQELARMFEALQKTEAGVESGFSRAELSLMHEMLDRMHLLCAEERG